MKKKKGLSSKTRRLFIGPEMFPYWEGVLVWEGVQIQAQEP